MPSEAGVDVVVVAAGASRRMGGLDKLGAPLGGRPLLARTLASIAGAPEVERIVVVAGADRVDWVRQAPWLPSVVVAVVEGGDRRQVSVAHGVAALDRLDGAGPDRPDGAGPDRPHGAGPDRSDHPDGDRVVLIHDGARPLVPAALIARVAVAARDHGAAIPVVPVAETVKRIEGDRIVGTVDRTTLGLAQTPQGFRRGTLAAAYARHAPEGPEEWTDEAALLESCSMAVHVVPGEPSNLKVTVPHDLARAEALLGASSVPRIGLGQDSHPFGPGAPLMLGGIEVPGAPRLHGHSDGDVALHAVADALLGAAAMGDLGRMFPADAATPAGVASRELLRAVVARLRDSGLRPAGVDLTITTARPRLAPRLDAMRDAIADLVGLPAEAVSVKASTGNLTGDEGAGRVVSAQALAIVENAP
jgi:2-C-methyl-D-erythritol 4-phosphate cytidylyltransferase/2-C-methyl-D-erythritol 2,4-cyclodiphosphate synthase